MCIQKEMKKDFKNKHQNIEELFNKNIYQVFVLTCRATMPFSLALHPWFLINKKGDLSRWEVFRTPEKDSLHWGHIHKNFYKPLQGIAKWTFTNKYMWKSFNLIGYLEGVDGSLAEQIVKYIESSPQSYPQKDNYSLIGPNSNTYVQWVLNKFPEANLHLPWNCFGKNKAINLCTEESPLLGIENSII